MLPYWIYVLIERMNYKIEKTKTIGIFDTDRNANYLR